jgi:sigma-E factor negative regulatory protein RseA
MADRPNDDTISFEALSAMADNEATEREVNRACSAWRDQPAARDRWSSYHLIGDVMRSEGLARSASSDADFLAAVRGRLEQEPVVLAPAALGVASVAKAPAAVPAMPAPISLDAARQLRHRRWSGPVSVAAGFVMVLSALVSTFNNGGLEPTGQGVPVALAPVPAGSISLAQGFAGQDVHLPTTMAAGLSPDAPGSHQLVSGAPSFNENAKGNRVGYLVFMRDDQLDQLMAAQRVHAASPSLASPQGATLQSVSFSGSAP